MILGSLKLQFRTPIIGLEADPLAPEDLHAYHLEKLASIETRPQQAKHHRTEYAVTASTRSLLRRRQ
ncbi:hypothetical protein XA68_17464 [Ophiocordyceps unilateralis]|uniref:Uncharacterized protein n=1 Tax=Ophiocordyceps unilateralis TaxID=268505 RepID=A0A2A9PKH9_OPHUN|nr:hypothetical protein XA68_17464 [Ophiocordyceps unilateralis]